MVKTILKISSSNATLNGTYAVTLAGWGTPPPKTATEGKSSIPIAVVGLSTFDGAGNWTSSFTYSHNGDIGSGTAVPGVYSINSDCAGSLTGVGSLSVGNCRPAKLKLSEGAEAGPL
jgi:hypothetical protein